MPTLLTDPEQYKVQPGPVGARAMGLLPKNMSGEEAMAASPPIAPAAALTRPLAPAAVAVSPQPTSEAAQGGQPDWMTPERQKFFEQAKRAGRNYRMAVEQRRKKRKAVREFSKVMGSLEREVGLAEDLRSVVETYKDLFYEGDAPNPQHMAVLRSAAKHVTAAERLREQAKAMRKKLQAQGISIPDEGDVDTDTMMDAEDQQFDEFIGRGYANGLATMP